MSRLDRAAENFRRRECFCGKPIGHQRFAMAWCDECLDEFNESDENMRLFIRRKEVTRGVGAIAGMILYFVLPLVLMLSALFLVWWAVTA